MVVQPKIMQLKSERGFHQLEIMPGAIAIEQGWKSFLQDGLSWRVLSQSGRQLSLSIVGPAGRIRNSNLDAAPYFLSFDTSAFRHP